MAARKESAGDQLQSQETNQEAKVERPSKLLGYQGGASIDSTWTVTHAQEHNQDVCSEGASPTANSPSTMEAASEVDSSQRVAKKRPINIVFIGKIGAGMSTLKHNIVGEEADEEYEILSLDHVTDSYAILDKETVKIDITRLKEAKRNTKKKLKQLGKYRGAIDLLVYCIPVDPSSKFSHSQPGIMKSLQDAFDDNIWKHCIIVFTFSNMALSHIKSKLRGDNDRAIEIYKKHINDYTDRVRAELTKLHVRQVSVKTVFDLPLEAPQPEDHTTIMAIPAGDEPEDQVLPGIQYEFPYQDQEDLPLKWTDVLFNEIVKLSKAEHKNSLLRYHYRARMKAKMKAKVAAGTLGGAVGGTAIGAAIGGTIGVTGGPVGVAVGAGVGSVTGMIIGIASGGAVSEQVTKK